MIEHISNPHIMWGLLICSIIHQRRARFAAAILRFFEILNDIGNLYRNSKWGIAASAAQGAQPLVGRAATE